jgi:hypothetical protein
MAVRHKLFASGKSSKQRHLRAVFRSAPTMPDSADRADRTSVRTKVPCKFIGSPASEQSADYAADQANWTAATAVVVSAAAAVTTGPMVAIGIAAVAGVGVRRRDGFRQ